MRFGLSMLRNGPGFTTVAVLTLALGIAANTAIFSISDAFIGKPLPFPGLDRLVYFSETEPAVTSEPMGISPANFLDWQSQAISYDTVSAWSLDSVSLTGHDAPLKVEAARVTPNFFTTLDAKPLSGRTSPKTTMGGSSRVVSGSGNWAPTQTFGQGACA